MEHPTAHRSALALITALAAASAAATAADPVYVDDSVGAGVSMTLQPDAGFWVKWTDMVGAVVAADFNKDDYPDLFVPGLGSIPDRLYINNQDGTFTDKAADWGIDTAHLGAGACAGDVNNDGYLDLYVVSHGWPAPLSVVSPDFAGNPGNHKLYLNNGPDTRGQFSFTNVALDAGVNQVFKNPDGIPVPGGSTPAFGDIDLDGDLDLYVATWNDYAGGNRLFENQFSDTGTLTFVDITEESRGEPDRGFDGVMHGFTPTIVDVNGDKYPDILVTGDFRTSEVFINNGPGPSGRVTFRCQTDEAAIFADNNAMGTAVADFNGDGLLDWFSTNIFRNVSVANTIYMGISIDQDGNPVFQNQAPPRGVMDNGWGWGVSAEDFDHDFDVDMIAVNGWPSYPLEQIHFWRNNAAGFFSEDQADVGLDMLSDARGIAALDFDKDLDLDIVIAENSGTLRFFRNDMDHSSASANAVRVQLDTDTHPCLVGQGQGAVVRATIGSVSHSFPVHNKATYLSQSELITHIGLGGASQIDTLEVLWSDGETTTLTNVAANQELTVTRTHPIDYNNDGNFNFGDVSGFLTAYATGSPSADLDDSGTLNFADVVAFLTLYADPCP